METRKLVRSGLGSSVIAVPKGWLDRHRLRAGDRVAIEHQGDNLLLLAAQPKGRSQPKRLTLDATESPSVLTRKLIAAYVEGYAEIVIAGARNQAIDAVLAQQIEALAGYEIVEKRKDRMVIHDLLRVEDLSPKDTFRKMDMTMRMMLTELADMLRHGKIDTALFIEEDRLLNKLHYTIARVIRATLRNELVLREYDDLYELLLLDHLSKSLEDFGDHLKYFAQEAAALSAQQQRQLATVYGKLVSVYAELLEAYHKRDRDVAYAFADRKRALHTSCGTLFRSTPTLETTIISRRLKSMLMTLADIARVIRYR